MTISKDLFLAILSMDSYNRGYGAGISLDGSQIGSATIGLTSTDPAANLPNSVAAGFYAVAYELDAAVGDMIEGTTVISYRGTDNFALEFPSVDLPIYSGDYDEAELALAVKFRRSVGDSLTSDQSGKKPDILLTGHSLELR